jgi:nicotinamidase-related amidase
MEDAALLVVDVINACCSERCERKKRGVTFKRIRRMVPKLAKFIEEYTKRGGTVVFVNCAKWDKRHLAKNIAELYENPGRAYFSADRTGFSEAFYKVAPSKGDAVFTKNTYDAFTNPKLGVFLKRRGVKRLVMTGVFGDGCVHSTIQGAFSKGYGLVILKDLIETTDVPARQKLQKLMKARMWPMMFGDTITSKKFLASY